MAHDHLRHIVAVELDERLLNILLRDGATVRTVCGIPRDAVLLGIAGDFQRRCIIAHFEHPSFPACELGLEPERRNVSFEILEHPQAQTHDYIPVRIGMNEVEYLDMRRWICEQAALITGLGFA